MENIQDDDYENKKSFNLIKFIFKSLIFLICLSIIIYFAIYVWKILRVSIATLYSYEKTPLLYGALRSAKNIVGVILPFIYPVIFIFFACFIIYVIYALYNEKRRFGSLGVGGTISVILASFQKFLLFIIKIIPLTAIVLTLSIGLNSVLVDINNLKQILDNAKRIRELNIAVKNLSSVEDIAKITLIAEQNASSVPIKTYKIDILSKKGKTVSSQTVTLSGTEIAIDFINVNFDYSEIESGSNKNIAYPYMVFSENQSADNGVALTCAFNEENIPVIYCLEDDDIYGIEKDIYFNRLKELFNIISDEEKSKSMGIRSVNGVVPHFSMNKGDEYIICVNGTGGLSVRRKTKL